MNDDQMDDLIIQGARSYNEPDQIPREVIWARVSAARRAAPAHPGTAVRTLARPSRRVRFWTQIGVAAAALLIIGVGIGRQLERRGASPASPTATGGPAVAQTPDSVPVAVARAAAGTTGTDSLIDQLRNETRSTQRQAEALAALPPSAGARTERAEPSLAYRLVVLRHLAGSDAMITAFRSSAERGEIDTQIAAWSRELLSTTRMLEASPATTDPTMKRLLEDLDLVIVQIARYASRGTNNSEDLDLIERSIDKRGVIAKLRSPLPRTLSGRNVPAGT